MAIEEEDGIDELILIPPVFVYVFDQEATASPIAFGITRFIAAVHYIQTGIVVPVGQIAPKENIRFTGRNRLLDFSIHAATLPHSFDYYNGTSFML